MKKIAISLVLISFCSFSFSQQTLQPKQNIRNEYQKKYKSQKITAWVLLGTGSAMMIVGGIEWKKDFNALSGGGNAGATIAYIGIPVAVASIPFFISSAKNKRRAEVSAGNTQVYFFRGNKAGIINMPSLKLTVKL